MPEIDGLEVIRRLRAADNRTPVLVLTADGSVNRAVEAMRAGASDFLIKPVGPERLDVSIRNALAIADLSSEVRRLTRAEENRLSFDELIANAGSTRAAIALARRAARSDIPILIDGESGTGKEVFARANHPYTQSLLTAVPRIEARKRAFATVKGEIPSPLDPPSGCHFHPRCPHAHARCVAEVPRLREVAPGHLSACHLNDRA